MAKKHKKVSEQSTSAKEVKVVAKGKNILGVPVNQNSVIIAVVLIIIGLIVGALAIGPVISAQQNGDVCNANLTSVEELKTKVANYLNDNLVLDDTIVASVSDVNSLGGGLYEMAFEVNQNGSVIGNGVLFATNEKVILGQSFNLDEPLDNSTTDTQGTVEVQKSDFPQVDLFVMSFCLYGNEAEDTMLPVYELLKDKAQFNIHFIVNTNGDTVQSRHGQPEVDQDEREACVLQNSGTDAWWSFATYVNSNCGSDGSCWEDAAASAGLDSTAISSCVATDGLALMQENEAIANALGVSGSPTLFVNGTQSSNVYSYGNSEAYKQAICDAFNVSPQECLQALGSTATGTSGSC